MTEGTCVEMDEAGKVSRSWGLCTMLRGLDLNFFQRIAHVSRVLWQDHENDIFKF